MEEVVIEITEENNIELIQEVVSDDPFPKGTVAKEEEIDGKKAIVVSAPRTSAEKLVELFAENEIHSEVKKSKKEKLEEENKKLEEENKKLKEEINKLLDQIPDSVLEKI